jgi:3-deoxy-D-manno-octulosonic-acid transferase
MNALDLLYLPLAIIAAPLWARKSRADWPARFGRTPPLPTPTPRKRLLIHAVSVGEVNTLRALIPLLKPHLDVVISVGTDTGTARARALFADESKPDSPIYLGHSRIVRYPLDLSWAVHRVFNAVRPDAVALVELELWPNFLREARRRAVPVAVINGRLSARSFRGYARLRRFFRPLFAQLAFAAVQDQDYADRFIHMGTAADRIRITGSMKWDSVQLRPLPEEAQSIPGAHSLAAALGVNSVAPLIVAGSTGPLEHVTLSGTPITAEEQLLDAACPQGAQLLCAPRKPERFNEAFKALGGAPRCIRRSTAPDPSPSAAPHPAPTRFLLDTIGELRAAYALATVAVIGRSFGGLHGSDPIEPISLNIPTVIGPHHSDFASIVSAFRDADAIEIAEPHTLAATLTRLLGDPVRRQELIANGRTCIQAHQGATARHAELLRALINSPSPVPR